LANDEIEQNDGAEPEGLGGCRPGGYANTRLLEAQSDYLRANAGSCSGGNGRSRPAILRGPRKGKPIIIGKRDVRSHPRSKQGGFYALTYPRRKQRGGGNQSDKYEPSQESETSIR